MMLGRNSRGFRGLGETCVPYDPTALKYENGGVLTFDMIQAGMAAMSNGGCIPAAYQAALPYSYLSRFLTAGESAQVVTSDAVVVPQAVAVPVVSTPLPVLTVGSDNAPVITSAIPGVMMDTVPQVYSAVPPPSGSMDSTPTPTTEAPAPSAPASSSSSSSSSSTTLLGLPATVGGIDTKYLLIGAVAAFFLMGRK